MDLYYKFFFFAILHQLLFV